MTTRKCSVCRQSGHRKPTCPQNPINRRADMEVARLNERLIAKTAEIEHLSRRFDFCRAQLEEARAAYEERDGQLDRALQRIWETTGRDAETQKTPMPTHISAQIWMLNEPECQICLMPTTEENFILTKCGHNFCDKCFADARVVDCGVCRQQL